MLVEKFGFRCFSSHLVHGGQDRREEHVRQGTGAPTSHSVKARELMIVIRVIFRLYNFLGVEYMNINMPAKVLKFRYKYILRCTFVFLCMV